MPNLPSDQFKELFQLPRESFAKIASSLATGGDAAKACIMWTFDFGMFFSYFSVK